MVDDRQREGDRVTRIDRGEVCSVSQCFHERKVELWNETEVEGVIVRSGSTACVGDLGETAGADDTVGVGVVVGVS